MKKTTTTCDHCQRAISEGGPMPSYRMTLRAEKIQSPGGFEYAVCVAPPLDREMHFCGTECLTAWVDTTRPVTGQRLLNQALDELHRFRVSHDGTQPGAIVLGSFEHRCLQPDLVETSDGQLLFGVPVRLGDSGIRCVEG